MKYHALLLATLTLPVQAQQAATPGAGLKLTSKQRINITAPLGSSALVAGSLVDQAGGSGVKASTTPTLGALYPLSSDFYITATGQVGIGTTTPASGAALEVVGRAVFGANNSASGSDSTMAGGRNNIVSSNQAVVGGGDANTAGDIAATVAGGRSNRALGRESVVAGGYNGDASGDNSAIVGGVSNDATGDSSFIGGGAQNDAGDLAAVGGGIQNDASGLRAVIAGGSFNTASAFCATIPGGNANEASGDYSLAAGYGAEALHDGAFVWSDSSTGWPLVDPFESTAPNQFLIRANGGVGIGTDSPLASLHVEAKTGDDPLRVRIAGATRFMVASNGATSVGANIGLPAFDLQVASAGTFGGTAGKPGGGSWSVSSDRRLKRDVDDLDGALERLLALRGVTYEYVDPSLTNELPGEHTGMIAQEVRRVFPEWIHEGPDGYLRLTFQGFEALTVEALRDLREEKDAELEALRREVAELRALVEARVALD